MQMGIICENGYKTNNLFNLNKLYFAMKLRKLTNESDWLPAVLRYTRWFGNGLQGIPGIAVMLKR